MTYHLPGRLQPTPRRSAKIQNSLARFDEPIAFVYLKQLERGPTAETFRPCKAVKLVPLPLP
jgi:hypothetical protein